MTSPGIAVFLRCSKHCSAVGNSMNRPLARSYSLARRNVGYCHRRRSPGNTFTGQMEALRKYRTGGEQKVTLLHVYINEGGQAVVSTVTHPGRWQEIRGTIQCCWNCRKHPYVGPSQSAAANGGSHPAVRGKSVCRMHGCWRRRSEGQPQCLGGYSADSETEQKMLAMLLNWTRMTVRNCAVSGGRLPRCRSSHSTVVSR
jgi:hypothetical protein